MPCSLADLQQLERTFAAGQAAGNDGNGQSKSRPVGEQLGTSEDFHLTGGVQSGTDGIQLLHTVLSH